jgi:deazaflavin-dependent oxidoreductase (nitroreductase family)
VSVTEQVLKVHHKLYVATDGRIGHKLIGVPTLLLRTIGRRSGAERVNSLVYATDGADLVVVPSNGGADKPPAWLHNLKAKPDVGIQIGRERKQATARVVEPDDPAFDRLWKLVNENNKDRYTAYQESTSRPIPVVALTPS